MCPAFEAGAVLNINDQVMIDVATQVVCAAEDLEKIPYCHVRRLVRPDRDILLFAECWSVLQVNWRAGTPVPIGAFIVVCYYFELRIFFACDKKFLACATLIQ